MDSFVLRPRAVVMLYISVTYNVALFLIHGFPISKFVAY